MRAAVLLIAAICIVTQPALAAEPLAAAPLKALLTGKTVTHISPRSGDAVTFRFKANGTVNVSTSGKKARQGVGKWSVARDGLFCYQVPELRKGKRVCHYLVKNGNRLMRLEAKGKEPKGGEDWVIQ